MSELDETWCLQMSVIPNIRGYIRIYLEWMCDFDGEERTGGEEVILR